MEKDLIEKAKECNLAEEIMALAKEEGDEITIEQAQKYYEALNPANGEVTDEEYEFVEIKEPRD